MDRRGLGTDDNTSWSRRYITRRIDGRGAMRTYEPEPINRRSARFVANVFAAHGRI